MDLTPFVDDSFFACMSCTHVFVPVGGNLMRIGLCSQEKEKGAMLMQQVEGQRQKLTVWGAMLDRADQVRNLGRKALRSYI